MHRAIARGFATAALLAAVLAVPPAVAGAPGAAGPSPIVASRLRMVDPVVAPTPGYARFLATFWDARTRTFFARSDHRPRTGGGRVADFWWTAQLWETVMDAYEHARRRADRARIDAVYDGFVHRFPTFASDFNDDRGWWALAAVRAYRLTGERRFLLRAEWLLDGIWASWDGTYGGGLWWRRSVHDQKNAATNGVAAMASAEVFRATGTATYRVRAVRLFRWMDTALRSGSRVDDHLEGPGRRVAWQFTYNYGVYAGAARSLAVATGTRSYLARAVTAADRAIATLAPSGVLRDEGAGDAGGFKGVFVRELARLASTAGRPRYLALLRSNAMVAFAHRAANGLNGSDWATAPAAGPIESLTEASAVALYEVVASGR